MSTNFSHREAQQEALETLERQQAIVLRALRGAHGEPVSFQALRDAGVEFPASVVAELELGGWEIERCHEGVEREPRLVGVRLLERDAGAPPEGLGASQPPLASAGGDFASAQRRSQTPSTARASRPRLELPSVPLVTVLAAAVAVLALVLTVVLLGSGGGHTDGKAHARLAISPASPKSQLGPAHRATARHAPTSAPGVNAPSPPSITHTGSSAQPPSEPVSLTRATQLEAQGHELVQAGRYSEAIPTLRRAIEVTGQSLDACLQPSDEACLTYAYALYDLGRALLLHGSAAAAVGVLESRLRIENQRPVVAAELQVARRQLG